MVAAPAPEAKTDSAPTTSAQTQTPAKAPTATAQGTSATVAEQIARLDKLLADGVISQREHDILVALAVGAETVAGAQSEQ
ncbi:MAG: hypothetical protein QM783_18050 [Phycisphaerales bacterium]